MRNTVTSVPCTCPNAWCVFLCQLLALQSAWFAINVSSTASISKQFTSRSSLFSLSTKQRLYSKKYILYIIIILWHVMLLSAKGSVRNLSQWFSKSLGNFKINHTEHYHATFESCISFVMNRLTVIYSPHLLWNKIVQNWVESLTDA